MTTPALLPCTSYAEPEDMRDCEPFDDVEAYSDAKLESALGVASRVMYLATGRQFHGVCTETNIRPCGCNSCGIVQDMGWGRIVWPGSHDCGGSCFGRSCSCTPLQQIELDLEPLATVSAVRIDGVALDASDYRIDDWRWLVRLDGEGWPRCQDMNAADDAVGSWGVDVTWGLPGSVLVVEGTKALGGEIAKACTPGANCSLPRGLVQSITRQGVSLSGLNPLDFLPNGLTGIYAADLAIRMENPGGVSVGARFYNPDDAVEHARRVGT